MKIFSKTLSRTTTFVANQAVRALILIASIGVAGVWANALLYVSEAATEVVFAEQDLQALLDEPALESPPPSDAVIGQHVPAPAEREPESESPPAIEDTNPLEEPPRPAAAQEEQNTTVADASTEAPVVNDDDPVGQVPLEQVPATEPMEAIELRDGNGALASFDGTGIQGQTQHGEAGQGGLRSGPAWDIRFHGEPTLELLERMEGARLAAVRHRRGFVEVALVRDGEISNPLRVEQLLRVHPEFLGRNGIVLDRRWLVEVEDRLLNYGGGWQAWLLIEDTIVADWREVVNAHVASSRLDWNSVQRIEAVTRIRRHGGRVHLTFAVQRIHQKPPPEPLPVEKPESGDPSS